MLRDYDHFETYEGFIFCVLGDVHPPNRYWSLLKYVPGDGPWKRNGISYKRVLREYTVSEYLESISFLKSLRPDYVFLDPTVDAEVIAPPTVSITRIHRAKDVMREIIVGERNGSLEQTALELCEVLSGLSGIEVNSFGITGSILLKTYHSNSDIDLLVYGIGNADRLMDALLTHRPPDGLKLVKDWHAHEWVARASRRYPLPPSDLRLLASRVVNKGYYFGRGFTVFAVRQRPMFEYGEYTFVRRKIVTARLRVKDHSESLCTPCVYRVEEDNDYGVDRIWCYDKMLAGIFREGDLVEVRGMLEEVYSGGREAWRQVLVGSYSGAGSEYIRLLGPP